MFEIVLTPEAIDDMHSLRRFERQHIREIELTRQDKRLTEMLTRRAKQTKTVPLNEAKAQLGLD